MLIGNRMAWEKRGSGVWFFGQDDRESRFGRVIGQDGRRRRSSSIWEAVVKQQLHTQSQIGLQKSSRGL